MSSTRWATRTISASLQRIREHKKELATDNTPEGIAAYKALCRITHAVPFFVVLFLVSVLVVTFWMAHINAQEQSPTICQGIVNDAGIVEIKKNAPSGKILIEAKPEQLNLDPNILAPKDKVHVCFNTKTNEFLNAYPTSAPPWNDDETRIFVAFILEMLSLFVFLFLCKHAPFLGRAYYRYYAKRTPKASVKQIVFSILGIFAALCPIVYVQVEQRTAPIVATFSWVEYIETSSITDSVTPAPAIDDEVIADSIFQSPAEEEKWKDISEDIKNSHTNNIN